MKNKYLIKKITSFSNTDTISKKIASAKYDYFSNIGVTNDFDSSKLLILKVASRNLNIPLSDDEIKKCEFV